MVGFYLLPEECIAKILSFTSPRDACTSSLVSSMFKSAADSDLVWEKFLPLDYQEIISRSENPSSLRFSSKKELYAHLSEVPILIDEGKKSFAIEKLSGKKCYMIGARELSIAWGDTRRYWRWRRKPDSRFSEVAKLVTVCWLELRGKMDTRILSPNTTYVAYLVVKVANGAHGLGDAEASVKFANGGSGASGDREVCLDPECDRMPSGGWRRCHHTSLLPEGQIPQERGDGWKEIELGELFSDNGENGEILMSLTEVKNLDWKTGLVIQGIELRPKPSV